jgi:hypothetical protein
MNCRNVAITNLGGVGRDASLWHGGLGLLLRSEEAEEGLLGGELGVGGGSPGCTVVVLQGTGIVGLVGRAKQFVFHAETAWIRDLLVRSPGRCSRYFGNHFGGGVVVVGGLLWSVMVEIVVVATKRH